MPLLCAAVALPAPVLDQRLDRDCTGIGTVIDRLHHILHHVPESRWDVPRVVAVGISSPSLSMNAALATEGLALNLTETAVLFCPLYAVTSKDPAGRKRFAARPTPSPPDKAPLFAKGNLPRLAFTVASGVTFNRT